MHRSRVLLAAAVLCVVALGARANATTISGSGTTNSIAQFTGTTSIGNSVMTQYLSPTGNGTYIGINTATPFGSLGIKCHQGYEIFGSDSTQHFNIASGGPMHLQPGFTVTGTVANPLATLGLGAGGSADLLVLGTKQFTVSTLVGVGIGTTPDTDFTAGFRLKVNGKIRAKEIKVDTNWSDFVFDSGYALMPLDQLEQAIHSQGHLPGIPSAQEVASNGIALGDMQARLLQKVEELTLYVIDLQKQNRALAAEVAKVRR